MADVIGGATVADTQIQLNAVDDPPFLTSIQSEVTFEEDSAFVFGVGFFDVGDVDSDAIVVEFECDDCELFAVAIGLSLDGVGTSSLTFSGGSVGNTLLSLHTVRVASVEDFSGSDTLTGVVTADGRTASLIPSITMLVAPANDAPSVTVTTPSNEILEDATFALADIGLLLMDAESDAMSGLYVLVVEIPDGTTSGISVGASVVVDGGIVTISSDSLEAVMTSFNTLGFTPDY